MHQVLQEHRHVDDAEEGGGQGVDALLGGPLQDDPDRADDDGERQEEVGLDAVPLVGPGRQGDQAAEDEAHSREGLVPRGGEEDVELPHREHRYGCDHDDGADRAEEPQHCEQDQPEDDGAEDALRHGLTFPPPGA